MKKRSKVPGFSSCLMALVMLLSSPGLRPAAEAATIILRSGEKFTTSRVWKEGSTVKFYLHGIVVAVPGADVQRIVDAPGDPSRAKKDAVPPPETGFPNTGKGKPRPDGNSSGPDATKPRSGRKPAGKAPAGLKTGVLSSGIDRLPFRGLRWRMRPAALGSLVRVKTEDLYGAIVQYAWKDRPLRWAKVELDGLIFGFWRNQLYSITMWVYGMPRFKLLRQEAFARYGRVSPVKKGSRKYIWVGRQTDALLEFDRKLNTGIFWLRSRELDKIAKRLHP